MNWHNVTETIECIRTIRGANGSLHIVVVSNGTSPDEEECLRDSLGESVDYIIHQTNVGFARGSNDGIDRCIERECEWVVLLNNDVRCEANELLQVVEQAEKLGAHLIGPIVVSLNNPARILFPGRRISGISCEVRNIKLPSDRSVWETDYVEGSLMAIHKDVFRRIGVLNSDYLAYWEEADFCARARKVGIKSWIAGNVRVGHKGSASVVPELRLFLLARNQWLYAQEHLSRIRLGAFVISQCLFFLPMRVIGDLIDVNSPQAILYRFRGLRAFVIGAVLQTHNPLDARLVNLFPTQLELQPSSSRK